MEPRTGTPRVLIVDDEPVLRRLLGRLVEVHGFDACTCASGEEAIAQLESTEFDAVVSDIAMPGLDGIGLLEKIRAVDLDLPIILITGSPSLQTAIRAVELGALHYLTKPLDHAEFRRVLVRAVQLCRMSRLRRHAMTLAGVKGAWTGDRAGLNAHFDRVLERLWMAFQPIVRLDGSVFGYEALMRGDDPVLASAEAILEAAEMLDRLVDLGRTVRERASAAMHDEPARGVLFVNLHPRELFDPGLTTPGTPLHRMADRVVLEVTERAAVQGLGDVRRRASELREHGFRIAIDDLGSGYAGLSAFAALQPDLVKIDRALVRGIDKDLVKQRVIQSLTGLCKDMGMTVVAEGIETAAERDAAAGLGCDLLQGFLFARPDRPFPALLAT